MKDIDQVVTLIITWLKRIVSIGFLVALAVTAITLLGVRTGFPVLTLDQGTGIALAGVGFLLSKL